MSSKKFIARFGVDNNNHPLSNVASPTHSTDAATKGITDIIDTKAGLAFSQANLAFSQANTAFTAANNVGPQLEPSFSRANSAYDQANTGTTQAQAAFLQANNAYTTANSKFNSIGGNITGAVTISSNLTVTGNLTVSGNVTTVSANNLILKDNMFYLNSDSSVTNPDLGFAGNYNDGIYHHAGFFRDASDGYWKVFDNYLPEPDASPYIDTSNSSFRIASFQANNIIANTFSGTSNNSTYFNGYLSSYYTNASNLSSGTLPNARLSSIPNSALANSSVTVNGTAISLGSSGTVTSATLTTARTLTIGSTGKTFNGSADVSWSLAEIGAAQRSGISTNPESSVSAADIRALTNPTTGLGYFDGVRFRFSSLNDDNASPYADVIDLSTYADSSGGGFNSLYFGKNSQILQHKYAAAGATSWTTKTIAYTDSNITGSAGSVAWSGVTSKPTTVSGYGITNALVRGGGIGNIDYNAQRTLASGIYSVSDAPTNGPAGGSAYSNFIQMYERGDTAAQLVIEYSTGRMYSRGIHTVNATYSPWRTQLDDGNYTSYAMPAGASATNSVDVRAPIFYDSNDTGYYVNPNGFNQLKYARILGDWGSSGIHNEQLTVKGTYASLCLRATNVNQTYWLIHNDGSNAINFYGGTGAVDGASWNNNFYVDQSGNATARGNVTAYSDERLKTNIKTIKNGIELVKSLRGVTFNWIDGGAKSIGLIAQEVENVFPELVVTNTHIPLGKEEETEVKSVDYSKLVSVLIQAIKEQQNQLDLQSNEINKLKNHLKWSK